MKVAIAQLNPLTGDIEYNEKKIRQSLETARKQGADLVVFGEMALSGTPLYDLTQSEELLSRCEAALVRICDQAKDLAVLLGTPKRIGKNTYNAVAYIRGGNIEKYIYKTVIRSRDEARFLTEACNNNHTVNLKGDNILVTIGEECKRIKADKSHSISINLCACPYAHGIIEKNLSILSRLSLETLVPVLLVNQVGGQADLVYHGASVLLNDNGKILRQLPEFEEAQEVIDLDSDFIPCDVPRATAASKISRTYQAMLLGLRDYFAKNNFKNACIGLSGGIDSAVVAVMAVQALGAENVRGVLMPSQFSSAHSIDDAVRLAENLHIRYDQVKIEPIYQEFMKGLSPLFEGTPFGLAEENLQARIRGTLLMALSNKLGNLVLNTSNKSEAAMGYGTLYGDTNGALSILGDLYKTEVYALARYINREKEVIPSGTMTKAPSAELRPDQKDSDSLPDYEELDAILYRLIEENQSVEKIIQNGFNADNTRLAARLLNANEYKRYQLPPVLRLSGCTLGKDRILPLNVR